MKTIPQTFLFMASLMWIAGCGTPDADEPGDPVESERVDAADFVLTTQPADAQPVLAVREKAADNDDVVISGRIGGSSHPWVEGVAAFTIVDATLPACDDEEDCNCPTPWDYCCESAETIAKHTATIKFVGDDNRPRRFDPKKVFDMRELQTVVVQGKAKRDDSGNLTVLAEKIFFQK